MDVQDRILFILSSIGEHSGCFHLLAIVSSATGNTCVTVAFGLCVFSVLDTKSTTDVM